MYSICRNKRPGRLIFNSNKYNSKTHRFCVLPPLKNHCFWRALVSEWAFISWWAFISVNTVCYAAVWYIEAPNVRETDQDARFEAIPPERWQYCICIESSIIGHEICRRRDTACNGKTLSKVSHVFFAFFHVVWLRRFDEIRQRNYRRFGSFRNAFLGRVSFSGTIHQCKVTWKSFWPI